MLLLHPTSVCDVCAEEYGSSRLPHCIPCGHILCAKCCATIIEKASPRVGPACPYCRSLFGPDDIRKLRIDFNAARSGPATPRVRSNTLEAPADSAEPRGWIKEDRPPLSEKERARAKHEFRRLEDRVAKIAAKRCSVDEVAQILKEVDDCLRAVDSAEEQPMSLYLSSALLRAILTNYHAHESATRSMKNVEANLKAQVQDVENAAANLQSELRKLKTQQSQKAQECQTLRVEVNRLKVKSAAASLGLPTSSTATSFASAGEDLSDASRPTSPISIYTDSSYRSYPTSSASSAATSPLASPVVREFRAPSASPLASPLASPSHVPSLRHTAHLPSTTQSASAGHYRSASVVPAHRTTTPTPRGSADLTRVSSPASPSSTRSSGARRSSVSQQSRETTPQAPRMLRSASEEEREREARMREREPAKPVHMLHQRWLPQGAVDARSPSAPPSMSGRARAPSVSAGSGRSPLAPASTAQKIAAAVLPGRYGSALRT